MWCLYTNITLPIVVVLCGNAKNRYELLIVLNSTLISQLIDKVDELDQIIKKL